jgi:hypothetical protein
LTASLVPPAGGAVANTARFETMFVTPSDVAGVWQTSTPSTYHVVPDGSIAAP